MFLGEESRSTDERPTTINLTGTTPKEETKSSRGLFTLESLLDIETISFLHHLRPRLGHNKGIRIGGTLPVEDTND